MVLTKEQLKDFKNQVISQIESTFSDDQKGPAIERVSSMSDEEFIEFLSTNNLLPGELEVPKTAENNENPFRMIINGKVPSYPIEENNSCVAVLEIRPISKGHTIIIPKKVLTSSENVPKTIISLAKSISKRITEKFKPKEVLISPSKSLGEIIFNLIPVYSEETPNSPRKQISKEELEELKIILEKKQKEKTTKTPKIKKIDEQKIWIPRRIP